MAIEDLYREAVLEHNRNPRNHRALSAATHSSRGLNALCGDDIQVQLIIDGEVIRDAAFCGEASAITMASASIMTVQLCGMSVAEALDQYRALRLLVDSEQRPDDALRDRLGELAALEGVRGYPSRAKSATLAWAAMKAAIEGRDIATTE